GSNAYGILFIKGELSAEDEAAIRQTAQQSTLFVQPYLQTVEGYGERSLVFIDGKFAHAFRKTAFYAFSGAEDRKDKEAPVYPSKDELALAGAIIERLKYR